MRYPVTDQDLEKLKNSFTYHSPKDDQAERYRIIRDEAATLALKILECCPQSRERSLAITQLETAVMWANKAIACNE